MELLNPGLLPKRPIAAALAALFLASGCAQEVTEVYPVETDTTISNATEVPQGESPMLTVRRDGGVEERILLKIPTKPKDFKDDLSEAFKGPTSLTGLLTFWATLPVAVLANIFSCPGRNLSASNLTQASLLLDVITPSAVSPGDLELIDLSESWWNTATWQTRHPFSASGRWETPGGAGTVLGGSLAGNQNGGALFDITGYFQNVISSNGKVYNGFMIRATNALLQQKFQSAQSSSSAQRPRIEATYTCGVNRVSTRYYLGEDRTEILEQN